MQIWWMLSRAKETLEVEPNETIESVKVKIGAAGSFTVDQLILFYDEQELTEPQKTLADYEIEENSMLLVELRITTEGTIPI